jgi:hypothetical protein
VCASTATVRGTSLRHLCLHCATSCNAVFQSRREFAWLHAGIRVAIPPGVTHSISTQSPKLLAIALLLAGCSQTRSTVADAGAQPQADVTTPPAATSDVFTPDASADGSIEASTDHDVVEASTDHDVVEASTNHDVVEASIDHDAPTPDIVDGEAGVCRSETPPRCGQARHVTSAADLRAFGEGLPWHWVNPGNPRVLSISEDLVADVAMTLDGSIFATGNPTPDGGCWPMDGRCATPFYRENLFRFEPKVVVPGVTCLSPIGYPQLGCAGVAISAGTTFRVRKAVDKGAVGVFNFVQIERACSDACGATETRCDANQVCLRRGYDICAWCEGGAQPICACRDQCGNTMPDGAGCSYDAADDISVGGNCRNGECYPDGGRGGVASQY